MSLTALKHKAFQSVLCNKHNRPDFINLKINVPIVDFVI